MDEQTTNEVQAEQPIEQPAAEPQQAEPQVEAASEPQPEQEPEPQDNLSSFLDSLTDEPGQQAQPEPQPQSVHPTQAAQPIQEPQQAQETPEEIERELLAEVKSERGQARIKSLLAGNRQLQDDYDRTKQTVDGFANMIRSTGMTEQEFGDTMRYCALVGAGDENSLKQALEMLDAQRSAICLKLGIDAPGIDPYKDYPDIKKDVDDMVITPEYARELVKARQYAAQQQAYQQQQEAMQQRQGVLDNFKQQAWQFVQHKAATDPQFKAKEAALVKAFQDHNLAQRFNPEHPETWIPQLEMLYDCIQASAPAKRPASAQPLRSRPQSLGTAGVTAPYGSVERTAQILDSLGI